MKQNLPNFLVVGPPKTGTTALYKYLKEHPEVFLPNKKELHFFSSQYILERNGGPNVTLKSRERLVSNVEEYKAFYNDVSNEKVIGDISPSYLFYSEKAAQNIKDTLGNVKIIILLRDPVYRAYSQYQAKVAMNQENESFLEALKQDENRKMDNWDDFWLYKSHSDYKRNIEDYIRVFGENNVGVFLYEELKNNPKVFIRSIFEFLGVNADFVPSTLGIIYNAGKHKQLGKGKVHRLVSKLKVFIPKAIQPKVKIVFQKMVLKQLVKKETFVKGKEHIELFANDSEFFKSVVKTDEQKYLDSYFTF